MSHILEMNSLFSGGYLVLYRLFIIRSSTIWTCTLVVSILQAVETELTDLPFRALAIGKASLKQHDGDYVDEGDVELLSTYLVATWTWSEVFVA